MDEPWQIADVRVPLDLAACADTLTRGFARLYGRHLLASLKQKLAGRLASWLARRVARQLRAWHAPLRGRRRPLGS